MIKLEIGNIDKHLVIFIKFIFENEKEFLKYFNLDGIELVNVYFAADHVFIEYMNRELSLCQHVVLFKDLQEFFNNSGGIK